MLTDPFRFQVPLAYHKQKSVMVHGTRFVKSYQPDRWVLPDRNHQYWEIRDRIKKLYAEGVDTFFFFQMGYFELMALFIIHLEKPFGHEIILWQVLPYDGYPVFAPGFEKENNPARVRYFYESEQEAIQDEYDEVMMLDYFTDNAPTLLTDISWSEDCDDRMIRFYHNSGLKILVAGE